MLLLRYTASDRIEICKSFLVDNGEAKHEQIKMYAP